MKRIVVGCRGSFATACDFMDIKDDLVAYGIEIIKATTKPCNLIVTPYAEIEVLDVTDKQKMMGKHYFDRCFGYARHWRHILQKEDDADERDDYLGSDVVDVVGYVLYLKEKEINEC